MSYRELFANREFSSLFVADGLSMVGTYLSRLAVSALVFARSDSVTLTALAFAISYAPYVFSPLLSSFSDRFAGRPLLVTCDLARAGLMLLVAIPGQLYSVMLVVLFLVGVLRIPFGASRLSLLADILTKEQFPSGNALVSSARQTLQVAGFAIGGVIITIVGTQPAIIFDAATFAVSGLIIIAFVKPRPAAWTGRPVEVGDSEQRRPPSVRQGMVEGLRVVTGTPRMQWLLVLMCLGPAILVVSEGVAVPFAHQLGDGTTLAGIVMAAPPVGTVVGLLVYGRLAPEVQRRYSVPLALMGALGVALAGVVALKVSWIPATVIVLGLAGTSLAYLNALQAEIAAVIPAHLRGRAFGLANSALQLSQGGAIIIAGLIAESIRVPETLIAMGVVFAGAVVVAGIRLNDSPPG
ncbi:MAG: MFS transporter, partial [Sciscionella sp.]